MTNKPQILLFNIIPWSHFLLTAKALAWYHGVIWNTYLDELTRMLLSLSADVCHLLNPLYANWRRHKFISCPDTEKKNKHKNLIFPSSCSQRTAALLVLGVGLANWSCWLKPGLQPLLVFLRERVKVQIEMLLLLNWKLNTGCGYSFVCWVVQAIFFF